MTGPIDIVSVGMVTAVGLDAPSSCAAMRAKLDGFQSSRFPGGDDAGLTTAPIPLERDFVGERRMAHIAASAINEAFDQVPEARGQTALVLCVAEEDRRGKPFRDSSNLLRRIADIVAVEAPEKSRIVAHGRPGGHVALNHARTLINSGRAPYVMVVGVDSYLTAGSVSYHVSAGRVLAPENPNGFIPGEAASAVLCAKPGKAGLRLWGLGLARELATIYNPDDLPLRADGMTSAYSTAFAETGMEMNRLGYRIADLIGEQYWFKQSALASLRLLRGRHEFQDIWSPAESLGNVGAAVVPLMLGMAFVAARKGYAAGNPVLVEASNEAGACGAAVLSSQAA